MNKKLLNKNVCFLLASLEPGGTEQYLLRFLTYFEKGINASIICKSGKLGELEEQFRKTGAKIIPLKTGYFNLLAWYRVFKIFKKNRFESVVDLTSNFGGVFMLLAFLAGIEKRITYYRQSSNHFVETKLRLFYDGIVKYLVYKFSTVILSNSNVAFHFFFKDTYIIDRRFEVIYNGIDSNKFLSTSGEKKENRVKLGINPDKFVIGHVGRFNSAKNHKTMIEVARIITSKYNNVEFLFCGRGTNSIDFFKNIEKYSLVDKVHLLGYREEIPLVLKSLDYFIFPSITEGQPNSLIEAMILGLPFCASNIDSIKESTPVFAHDFLVNPNNVNDIISLIENYINKPNVLIFKEISVWAVSKYDPNIQFNKFYDKL